MTFFSFWITRTSVNADVLGRSPEVRVNEVLLYSATIWHPPCCQSYTAIGSYSATELVCSAQPYSTVQPRDSGRLAPPTEPTESHGGRPSIPTHNYTIFPIPWHATSSSIWHRRS